MPSNSSQTRPVDGCGQSGNTRRHRIANGPIPHETCNNVIGFLPSSACMRRLVLPDDSMTTTCCPTMALKDHERRACGTCGRMRLHRVARAERVYLGSLRVRPRYLRAGANCPLSHAAARLELIRCASAAPLHSQELHGASSSCIIDTTFDPTRRLRLLPPTPAPAVVCCSLCSPVLAAGGRTTP